MICRKHQVFATTSRTKADKFRLVKNLSGVFNTAVETWIDDEDLVSIS